MSHLLRFLALYDWPESFDFAQHPTVVVGLVENADIHPTKLTVSQPGRRTSRRRTLTAKLSLRDALTCFDRYDWIALDEPIDDDFRNIKSQMALIQDKRSYTLTKLRSQLSLSRCLDHLSTFCALVTPRYGFMHSAIGMEALTMPAGVGLAGSDRLYNQRVDDWGRSLILTKEHLAGKLHDVYALNVLSPPHLGLRVEGRPLGVWIAGGSRGELREIKPEVYAWIVPDDVRAEIRSTLFNEDALIATI